MATIPTFGCLYQQGWPLLVTLESIISSDTRKNACNSSMSQPKIERSRTSLSLRGRLRICRAVSGTERPRFSFPPGVLASRDCPSRQNSLCNLLRAIHTLVNHSSALAGRLYLVAAACRSCTSDGHTDSNSAREVFSEAMSELLRTKLVDCAHRTFVCMQVQTFQIRPAPCRVTPRLLGGTN